MLQIFFLCQWRINVSYPRVANDEHPSSDWWDDACAEIEIRRASKEIVEDDRTLLEDAYSTKVSKRILCRSSNRRIFSHPDDVSMLHRAHKLQIKIVTFLIKQKTVTINWTTQRICKQKRRYR